MQSHRRLVGLVLALFIAVRVASLTRYDFWFDELFSIAVGLGSWNGLIAQAAGDQTNPPLFYLLVKAWRALVPFSAAMLRLLPCLFGIAAAWAVIAVAREGRFTDRQKLAMLILAAVSPQLVFYSVELRAYALLFLLGTISLALTLRLLREPPGQARLWAGLTAVNILLVYTHYFGWFTVLAEGVAFLFLRRDRFMPVAIAITVTGLAFLPWAWKVAALARARGDFAPTIAWVPRPRLVDLLEAPGSLLVGTHPRWYLAGGLLFAVALITWLAGWRARPEQERQRDVALAVFLLVPLGCAFAASWMLPRSIWVARNFIAAAVPVLAIMVIAAGRITPARGFVGAVAFVALAEITALTTAASAKIPWNTVAQRVAAEPRRSAAVYAFEGFTALPVQYYLDYQPVSTRVEVIKTLDSVTAPEGWILAREGSWPGSGTLTGAVRARGLTVTDSMELAAPGQDIRLAHYRR